VHQIKNGITVTPKYGIGAGLKEMLETLDRQARRLAAKKGREK
jgi:hypothetical protein